ncbi:hypothetical protein K443DRAFT_123038 [Laccaria amethystina LaAM-08-1]|uniref:Uncharacterized protein n=1 Tax=Laccaria amethystina LaAM-08-1 TaxID=1095629 RepID=A0A0C9X4H8_9AGAR|nr:hypothetical protein K443DRAFT_123038 [Laccaria amethystina LaAM-08-1]
MVSARGNIALVVKGCWNEDAQHFEQLKIALKTIIGFSNFDMLRRRASSLLPSSTFEFTVYHHRNADAAIVRNTYVLEIVANFFGIQSAALEAALSYKTKLNWVQKHLFESHVNEYNLEGNALVPQVPYFDNPECIRLLQNTPGGLIHMDDQARRQPKKTNHAMVEAFQKRWGNHSSFKAGAVERSSPLSRTDGLEVTGSINPFVKGLFFTKAIATQAHPRNENTIVAVQQAVKPEIAKRRMDMFVVNMTPEFCGRYSEGLEVPGKKAYANALTITDLRSPSSDPSTPRQFTAIERLFPGRLVTNLLSHIRPSNLNVNSEESLSTDILSYPDCPSKLCADVPEEGTIATLWLQTLGDRVEENEDGQKVDRDQQLLDEEAQTEIDNEDKAEHNSSSTTSGIAITANHPAPSTPLVCPSSHIP